MLRGEKNFWDMNAFIVISFVFLYLFFGIAFSCHSIDRWDDYKVLKRCIVASLWLPICIIAFIGAMFYVFFEE